MSFRILQLLLTVSRRSPTHPTTRITVQRVLIYSLCECFNTISRLSGLHDVSSRIFYKFGFFVAHTKKEKFWCKTKSDMSTQQPGGGGGVVGVLTPNFGRYIYVPQQSEKMARAPERAPGRVWKCGSPEQARAVLSLKMGGSGTSLSPFKRENAGLRNGR